MTLRNRDNLLKKLAAIQGAPRAAMRAALQKNAAEITDMQKRLAPVQSGDLRNSIGYTFGKYKAANSNVRGVVGGDGAGDPDLSVTIHAGDEKAWYAAILEFGVAKEWTVGGKFAGATHPGMSPEPYFYPSWRALRRRSKSRLTRAMRKAIKDQL
jgi:HK97 gp10 family phage protein